MKKLTESHFKFAFSSLGVMQNHMVEDGKILKSRYFHKIFVGTI